jgi:L-rhamnose mutarotase
MTRVAFVLNIKPGSEDEYRRRHENLWPEVAEEMEAAGIHSMSIFLVGTQAILFLEAEDYERSAEYLGNAPASRRWEEYMAQVLEGDAGTPYDPHNAWPKTLPLVFEWGRSPTCPN